MLRFAFDFIIILVVLCYVAVTASAESNYNTVGLRRHVHQGLPWSYAHTHNWEGVCKTGVQQSPVSFVNVDPKSIHTSPDLRSIEFSTKCHLRMESSQVIAKNTDYGIHIHFAQLNKRNKMAIWDSCLTTDPVSGKAFEMREIDFHVGPEHRFPDLHAQAEMHIKFRAKDREGAENPYLFFSVPLVVLPSNKNVSEVSSGTELLDRLLTDGQLPPVDAMTSSGLPRNISFFEFLPDTDTYLTYMGSLPQPPCTEGVRWIVFTTPLHISRLAFSRLQESIAESNAIALKVAGNARKPQPLHNRVVLRYKGGTSKWMEEKNLTKKFGNIGNKKRGSSPSSPTIPVFQWLRKASIWHWLAIGLLVLIVLGVVRSAWSRWRRPAVVGVDPRDVQPLISPDERRRMYGMP